MPKQMPLGTARESANTAAANASVSEKRLNCSNVRTPPQHRNNRTGMAAADRRVRGDIERTTKYASSGVNASVSAAHTGTSCSNGSSAIGDRNTIA